MSKPNVYLLVAKMPTAKDMVVLCNSPEIHFLILMSVFASQDTSRPVHEVARDFLSFHQQLLVNENEEKRTSILMTIMVI